MHFIQFLCLKVRYEQLAGMVGLTGQMAKSQEEVGKLKLFSRNLVNDQSPKVAAAVAAGLARSSPSIVNVIIRYSMPTSPNSISCMNDIYMGERIIKICSPTAGRKAQAHEWLTRAKL